MVLISPIRVKVELELGANISNCRKRKKGSTSAQTRLIVPSLDVSYVIFNYEVPSLSGQQQEGSPAEVCEIEFNVVQHCARKSVVKLC